MALGYMHLHGLGTPVNVSAAIDFYEGAASMGYADACYYLGGLYGGRLACSMTFLFKPKLGVLNIIVVLNLEGTP